MIPKIIHLCWLSGDMFPNDIQKCIESWKYHLPDYEIWLWGKLPKDDYYIKVLNIKEVTFDINSTLWTKQAFENRKYAFAADYIRLYALYHYGGIYLDSDIIVYKSFNDLLDLPYFIGQAYERQFEPAVIGCEKGLKWIKDIINHYNNRSFIKKDETFDMLSLPKVFYYELKDKYQFYRLHKKQKYEFNKELLYVFDQDFFNSRNAIDIRKTSKSYCAHNYAGSWVKKDVSFKSKLKDLIPSKLLNILLELSHSTINKKRIRCFEPPFINK